MYCTIKLRHTFEFGIHGLIKEEKLCRFYKNLFKKLTIISVFKYRFGVEVEGGGSMFVVLVWVGVVGQVRVGGVMSVGGIVGGMRMMSCSLKKKNIIKLFHDTHHIIICISDILLNLRLNYLTDDYLFQNFVYFQRKLGIFFKSIKQL